MSRRAQSFGERYPDRARSGSSANLIAGELVEARRLIPRRVDLRDAERVERSLMFAGLEPFPREPVRGVVRGFVAEHWQGALGVAICLVPTPLAMLIFWT